MKLIRNPNAWSCLLASMAMVLDKSIKELIEKIGHDGSEIVFPELPEPGRRRGFHIQEFIRVILESGYSVMPIEALPCSTPDGEHEYSIDFLNFEDRFRDLMATVPGIITGSASKWNHAVAWSGWRIYDPLGEIYNYEKCTLQIDVFYRFDRIKSL